MLLDNLLSNLTVHVCPFAICSLSPGWRLHLPGPVGVLLHFVLKGNGKLYGPRGDVHPLAPLHMSIVPIGAKHVLEASGSITDELVISAPPSGEQVCEIVAGSADHADLVVGCGLIEVRYGTSLNLFDHLNEVIAVDLSGIPQVLPIFEGILAEQSQAIAGSDAMTAALMTQCLVYFFRGLQERGDEAFPWLLALQDERLGRVVELILAKPGNDYSVETLADAAAMSRSAFTERFAKAFGRSPMSFVNHVRMQRASELLVIENLSIDEVARNVGYSSRSHFSRAFKDHAGMPPADFRAEMAAH